jgi:hypothetical protein
MDLGQDLQSAKVADGDEIEVPSSRTASGQIFMPPPKKRPLPTAASSRVMRRASPPSTETVTSALS